MNFGYVTENGVNSNVLLIHFRTIPVCQQVDSAAISSVSLFSSCQESLLRSQLRISHPVEAQYSE